MLLSNSPKATIQRGILDVPYEGTFVAFSIDTAASLRYYCRGGDAIAKAQVENLTWKQYAGYCAYWYGLPDHEAEYNRICIRPVQIGLTQPRPNRTDKFKHTSVDMCVPISPASEHPLGRPSLPISKPLPWSNCYQTTTDDFDVLIEPEDLDYSSSPEFSARTDRLVGSYTSEDARRINAMDAECTAPARDGSGTDGDASESASIQSDIYTPDISDDVAAVEDILLSSTDADPMWNKIFTPAVKVNPDLSVIKTLSDPAELWDEHAALKRIVDACKARRRATDSLYLGKKVSVRPSSRGVWRITLMPNFSNLAAKLKRAKTRIVRRSAFKTVQSVV